ncbi:MAG: TIGR03751 family conjugal transfer lipoprotein [Gammaproteobacteria bacterium]|nr:TIGR03751 family conjugal transfer lipoprotein [Gammaproteobacteria bacterium]
MQPSIKQVTVLVSISLLVGGCASTKEAVLPQDGPSMQAIYDAHLEEMAARDPLALRGELGTRPLKSGDTSLEGYTRDAHNEIETIFPRLPNSTLVMYVFPHLATEERVPVPGYVTTFPMYERVEYALPGEVSSGYSGDKLIHSDKNFTDQNK